MKNKLTRSLAAVVLLSTTFIAPSAFAELAVIVHPSNSISRISKSDLSDIYLGRSEEFANGSDAEPLDQESQSPARRQFNKAVLSMDEGMLRSYWSKLMFSGKGQPPEELSDDDEVRSAVAANPRAIGYIDKSAVNSSVKVILIIP